MFEDFLSGTLIYFLIISMFLLGIYGVINKKNLLKKLIALNITQVSVIIFFLALGQKRDATIPVILPGVFEADRYTNPLPQAMMLTAIVVSLAIAGVGLVLLKKIANDYGSIEEDQIIKLMKNNKLMQKNKQDMQVNKQDMQVNKQNITGGNFNNIAGAVDINKRSGGRGDGRD
ncbi:sodium:proton antiporter [Desulfuribacillus alkaliarsenatis]|uniref:NADH-quinone oxidoreductase subunit J n=1 Tax=Desulfuribacillus alkaliarsenatis TaxID=766136 RepID=A0A1E5G595_9FIRM|nr:cation:proton antiporter subunit C [Desulfuribacillus alkaliarsenatis]OEF97863.1 hypothetical protein BHF68_13630 [Desulfuribacillus alkaliarsenatis]